MSFRSNDTAIDEIVASCNGDLRGAVRALLLINEHLETELARLTPQPPITASPSAAAASCTKVRSIAL